MLGILNTLTPETWDNPTHLSYLLKDLVRHKEAVRSHFALCSPQAVVKEVAEHATLLKTWDLADKVIDPYLRFGLVGLYKNWERFSEYLLTPKIAREPLLGNWVDFQWYGRAACIGACCLAARASENEIATQFNNAVLVAAPASLPAELEAQFIGQLPKNP